MKYINLVGTHNFRDIGGYRGHEGKKVKYNKIYRSDALNYLTNEDIEHIHNLGINVVIDYRSEKERVGNEDKIIPNASYYYLDPKADVAALASSEIGESSLVNMSFDTLSADFAKNLMTQQNVQFVVNEHSIEAYRQMFRILLDTKTTASVQHCRGGKDRTGYGIALILFSLGVSDEDILDDYMLTNVYKKEKNEESLKKFFDKTGDEDKTQALRYLKEAYPEFLLAAFSTIYKEYGSPTKYLESVIGLTQEEISKLREMYLE